MKEPGQARLFAIRRRETPASGIGLRTEVENNHLSGNDFYRVGECVKAETTIRIRWIIIITRFIPFAGAGKRDPITAFGQESEMVAILTQSGM
jgi:hypothetical protein